MQIMEISQNRWASSFDGEIVYENADPREITIFWLVGGYFLADFGAACVPSVKTNRKCIPRQTHK